MGEFKKSSVIEKVQERFEMPPQETSPSVDIHATLRDLVSHGERLELTNSYQGVTLIHNVSKILIEPDCAHFNSPTQISSLGPGQVVYIHHQSLPKALVATISEVDWVRGGITASQIQFSDHTFQPRGNERVQPGHPIRAMLVISQNTFSTCLLNISESGLGLLIYRVNEKKLALERIHHVQIGIRLPKYNSPLMLSGTITRVNQIGNSAMASLGVQITPTEKQKRQLKSYIHSRQAEIFDELSHAGYIGMDPIETKNLYF